MNQRIIYENNFGGVSIITPCEGIHIEEIISKDIPLNSNYIIVNADSIPTDRTFRDAWEIKNDELNVNLDKSKTIAHSIRRALREEEFKPYDEVIYKKIPNSDVLELEAKREAIRIKYQNIQHFIDKANSISSILSALSTEPKPDWLKFLQAFKDKPLYNSIYKKLNKAQMLIKLSNLEDHLLSNFPSIKEFNSLSNDLISSLKEAKLPLSAKELSSFIKLALDHNIDIDVI